MPILAIQYPNGHVEQKALADGSYLVGRDVGDIVLGDADVSANHARLDVRNGLVFVTDLGSTNGTSSSDGRRVAPGHQLETGNSIQLGSSSITLLSDARAGRTTAMAMVPDPGVAVVQTGGPSTQAALAPSTSKQLPTELTLQGKRVLVHSGLVAKTTMSAYTATHVSGGGSTTNYSASGYASTTQHQVTSHVTHHTLQEIWIRKANGTDVAFRLYDSGAQALEGHYVSFMTRAVDDKVVRILNHTTGYYYRDMYFVAGTARQLWSKIWPFLAGPFLAGSCLNLFFLLKGSVDAFGKVRGWATSSPLLKLVLTGTFLVILSTYVEIFQTVDEDSLIGSLMMNPTTLGKSVLSYIGVVAFYIIRARNSQLMATTLDKKAAELL